MLAYVFLALGLVSLMIFCIFRDKKSSSIAICWKSVTSILFVATAVTASIYNENVLLPSALLTVGGLVLGLVGDITLDFKILLKNIPYGNAEKDSDNMTYVGMAAFAAGHILYILATMLRNPADRINMLWSALIALGLTAIIFALSLTVMKMRFGKFLLPSIGYAFLLSWFVVYSAWQISSSASVANVLLLVGAVMFIVSDLILSMTYFSKEEDYKKEGPLNPESKLMIVSNHVTYYVAQFAIALAIMFM